VLIRRHHLGDGRRSGLQRDKQEAAPVFERDGKQPMILGPETRIFGAMRHADQPPVAGIAPRVIGAGQHLGAAAGPVDQPRPTVAADVGKSPDCGVVAADDDDALAEIFEAAPLARLANLVLVADDLRRGAQKRRLLGREEFRVVVEPAGQTHRVERVCRRLNGLKMRGHDPHLPFQRLCGNGRSAWGGLCSPFAI